MSSDLLEGWRGPSSAVLMMILLFTAAGCNDDPLVAPESAKDLRPNILLIVVDDLGFNDLGVYGSEIETPNIDSLARNGVTFTDFNAAPTCSPTRAMLLTGADNHLVGLGWMAEVLPDFLQGRPGYEGYLNQRAATLPELLRDAGYNTYAAGKWHLGMTEETSAFARGFERTFMLANGGAGSFSNQLALLPFGPTVYRENGKAVTTLPDDFYATKFYTDKMREFIDSDRDDDKPFFAYLSYTSPHWPLQAPRSSIAKYQDTYSGGYDKLNHERLTKLKDLGLYDRDVEAFPRMLGAKPWDELTEEEQQYEARKMAIYAAMVDDVDFYIGQIVDHLKAIGEFDNTMILFMSDNGPEGNNVLLGPGMQEFVAACCDNSYENIGNADSYVMYESNWAQAGNTPLRTFKSFASQGGIRVPAIAHYPARFPGGRTSNEFLTIKDVMPTILELADVEHPGPGVYQGRDVIAMEGRSMSSLLQDEQDWVREPEDYEGWELFGLRAIRKGDWKIMYVSTPLFGRNRNPVAELDSWQLYNLADDPTESNDLASQHPEKLAELVAHWDDYAARNNVFIRPEK